MPYIRTLARFKMRLKNCCLNEMKLSKPIHFPFIPKRRNPRYYDLANWI